jgi:hypothetical protein
MFGFLRESNRRRRIIKLEDRFKNLNIRIRADIDNFFERRSDYSRMELCESDSSLREQLKIAESADADYRFLRLKNDSSPDYLSFVTNTLVLLRMINSEVELRGY